MEFFKKIKKEFGETAAKELKNIPFDNVDVFIKRIKQIIPIKETRSEVIKKTINILIERISPKEEEEEEKETNENIKDILDRANYEMIIPSSLEEAIKDFQKYYKNDEVICSLRKRSDRFENSHVAFFVKKNINEIERGEFPEKKDEYSTSLLCVQISKNSKMLKCISRYNHSVDNCDFVYTNLDEISWGLHNAFYKFFNENPYKNEKIQLPDGVIEVKGQFFQYIKEFNGNYWGKGFVLTNKGELNILDIDEEILIDGTIFDKKGFSSKFGHDLQMPHTEKIVKKNKNEFRFIFKNKEFLDLKINENLEITHIIGDIKGDLGNRFLSYNENLEYISLPYVKEIGDDFLFHNKKLTSISLPYVKELGRNFLFHNKNLTYIYLPLLEKVGNNFLYSNENKVKFISGDIKEIGSNFLRYNKSLEYISLPFLEKVGNDFLYWNENLEYISFPLLKEVGNGFLRFNENLKSIDLRLLEKVGNGFLCCNEEIEYISLPFLKEVGNDFLHCNKKLKSISFPLLEKVGKNFLHSDENKVKIINSLMK
jgi:hypothetical protein